jgi:hypothetical protein
MRIREHILTRTLFSKNAWLWLSLSLTSVANAQVNKPTVKLEKDQLLIGQQTKLELNVSYRVDQGQAVNIQWPAITDTLTGHIEVVHDSGVDTILPDKERDPMLFAQTRTLTLTSWDSGYWAIPPFRLVIDGDTQETEALLITVNTVEVDTAAAPKDIKEIYEVSYSWVEWLQDNWPWVAGGAAVVAGLTVLVMRLLRRKPKPKELPKEPEKPLHVRTLLALEELDKKQLWQQGLTKEYHSGVTDILRGYIEERFGVPALERTTDELLAALRMSSMNTGQREQLANLLRLADMVKFAKWTPLPTENEQLLAGAIKLVQQTTDALDHTPSPGHGGHHAQRP